MNRNENSYHQINPPIPFFKMGLQSSMDDGLYPIHPHEPNLAIHNSIDSFLSTAASLRERFMAVRREWGERH